MEIEQVAELARAVAALPQAEKDFFDGLVADERAKAAAEARIASSGARPSGSRTPGPSSQAHRGMHLADQKAWIKQLAGDVLRTPPPDLAPVPDEDAEALGALQF